MSTLGSRCGGEVAGPGGGLFPVLDVDITLAPAGEHSATLRLTGAYRSPPGDPAAEPDQAAMHRFATATIRAFLRSVTEAIVSPSGAYEPAAEANGPVLLRRRPSRTDRSRRHGLAWRVRPHSY